jgi:inosose dehydratase
MSLRIAANPLSWMNSDIPSLGESIPTEQCISEIALIGYKAVELEDPLRKALKTTPLMLQQKNLELLGGWHSCFLMENSLENELARFKEHLEFLQSHGSSLAIIAECSGSVHRESSVSLSQRPSLQEKDWESLCSKLDTLTRCAHEYQMDLAYHHHMGTLIQDEADIDRLMAGTRELGLLLDTGHLLYAGASPDRVLEKHFNRVNHCHMKNIRCSVLRQMLERDKSFPDAILSGVFTVPGDNGYADDDGFDFFPIIRSLSEGDYDGWIVMEAEQDPAIAHPFSYARLGYQHLQYLVSKASLALEPVNCSELLST